jgi:acetoin utilization deacetylase AcuC-like enzyme
MLKVAWSPVYNHPLPEGHRFPMVKYDLIPEQLVWEGTLRPDNFFEPDPLPESQIILTHTIEYWHKLKSLTLDPLDARRTGFPLTRELVNREIVIMDGTIKSAGYALENGVSLNVAGGTHHAYAYKGEGFCLLNDHAIAANYLLENRLVKQILIVDLDVHQGNGTASIFAGKSEVFTFSMHARNNIFSKKEFSDLDIELPDGVKDKNYLEILDYNLKMLIDKVEPDFIFYQSGVDVLESDKLGKIALSRTGCAERDRIVLETCSKNRIPVEISMGGGYSPRISDIVEAHCNTFRKAMDIFF